ncbi:TatD family hydrolase [Pseudoalteromonas ardens]|uniref:DNase TatD n=1 Tax=Pseudoalteromonas rubra TaxID=43658 RepID=A0A0L0EP95_9GAMM|nr:TatD family hydrolase [Pseudoalteromonas sp. R96]KNC66216.1 DNase TatD [Pseudoalteromonas rubra]MDK1313758.1 TatD family hydrolase [Pseudoalteromonas sp. R96]
MATFIDAGVNLTSTQFDTDRAAILTRAADQGVASMLLIGCDLLTSEQSLALAQEYNQYATAGVHPHDAKDVPDDFIAQLRHLAAQDHVVAIGECGLDFNRDYSPRPVQQLICGVQLELAQTLDMPVYLHEREAFDTLSGMLDEFSLRGVLHCFTGDKHALRHYLDYGLMIGLTGWLCDERRGETLRELVRYIPQDRILLETDAPFLLPRTLKPKPKSRRNEPAYLPEIAHHVAALKDIPLAQLARQTTENFNTLFQISGNNA